jgi:hypothetical protein
VRCAAAILSLSLGGTPLAGQSLAVDSKVAAFVTDVRAATDRYRNRAAAIADGYRRIGPDFPSMGEHWISIPLIVRGEVDPLRPSILEYVSIAGQPVLAGVAYTELLRDGMPPAGVPAPLSAWHNHAGSVDEESFMLSHGHESSAMASVADPKIAVLHAWLWLENPAGIFAADNWALPWYRLGMAPPSGTDGPSPGGFAAALASDGADYFLALLRLRHSLPPERADRIAAVLQHHGRDLRNRIQVAAAQGQPPSELELARAWSAVEADLRAICPPCTLPEPAGHQ